MHACCAAAVVVDYWANICPMLGHFLRETTKSLFAVVSGFRRNVYVYFAYKQFSFMNLWSGSGISSKSLFNRALSPVVLRKTNRALILLLLFHWHLLLSIAWSESDFQIQKKRSVHPFEMVVWMEDIIKAYIFGMDTYLTRKQHFSLGSVSSFAKDKTIAR